MIYFYIKGREEKVPCYLLRSTNLFQDLNKKFDALKVSYNEEKIDNLTVSTLFFWNSGRKTIRDIDIAQNDPLVLKVKDGYKILNVKILNSSTNKNNYRITLSPDSVSAKLLFDYIDKDEGMIVQTTHTGNSSHDLKLSGTIIGAKKLNNKKSASSQFLTRIFDPFAVLVSSQKYIKISPKTPRYLKSSFLIFVGMVYLFVATLSWFSIIDLNNPQPTDPKGFTFIFFIGGTFFIMLGINEIKRRIPKAFQVFYDELEF